MKYEIENINNTEYLGLVNSEAEPTDPNLKIRYCKLPSEQYFVYANSNRLGKHMSALSTKTGAALEEFFDEETKKVHDLLETRKDITPTNNFTKLLSF